MPAIDDLSLARKLIGFARIGVVPHETLVSRATLAITNLAQEQVASLAQSRRLLTYLSGRVLPSVAKCSDGLIEIDALLLPLRHEARRQMIRHDAPASRPSGERG